MASSLKHPLKICSFLFGAVWLVFCGWCLLGSTAAQGIVRAETPGQAAGARSDSAGARASESGGPELGNPRVAQRPDARRKTPAQARRVAAETTEVPPEPKLANRPRPASAARFQLAPGAARDDRPIPPAAPTPDSADTRDDPAADEGPILDGARSSTPRQSTLFDLLDESTSDPDPEPKHNDRSVETRPSQRPADAQPPPRETDASSPESLPPETQSRLDRVRRCLNHYYREKIDVSQRSPWGLMHAMLAFGAEGHFYVQSKRVNAVTWLCYNGAGRNQRLFFTKAGRLQANIGPGVQGHEGQFLAMLAQLGIARESPIRVDGRNFTVQHLVEYEMRTCRPRTELTFKLIGLVHYLDSDATWTTEEGETFDIPRLIRDELAQPVVGGACGGTHRLMGFSRAVKTRAARGEPIEGQWLRAKVFLDSYHEYTFGLQNPDGSFSTNWFEGRGAAPDDDRRLQTTGHILEWMVFSLSDEQLDDPRLTRCVDYLVQLMLENRNRKWEIGPRGHALRALLLYDRRIITRANADAPPSVADQPPEARSEAARTATRTPPNAEPHASPPVKKPIQRERFRRE